MICEDDDLKEQLALYFFTILFKVLSSRSSRGWTAPSRGATSALRRPTACRGKGRRRRRRRKVRRELCRERRGLDLVRRSFFGGMVLINKNIFGTYGHLYSAESQNRKVYESFPGVTGRAAHLRSVKRVS